MPGQFCNLFTERMRMAMGPFRRDWNGANLEFVALIKPMRSGKSGYYEGIIVINIHVIDADELQISM